FRSGWGAGGSGRASSGRSGRRNRGAGGRDVGSGPGRQSSWKSGSTDQGLFPTNRNADEDGKETRVIRGPVPRDIFRVSHYRVAATKKETWHSLFEVPAHTRSISF